MAWLDSLATRLGYTKAPPEPAPVVAPIPRKRAFSAAQHGRLTAGWPTGQTSYNYDIRAALESLRARSRDLAQNNDYARKYLQMVTTNVVGPEGFTLQSRVVREDGRQDEGANRAIEAAFAEWSRRGVCEVSRKLSFVQVQQLLTETAARDGEFLVRKVRSRDVNGFGFALQILDVDRLDTQHNETLPNGRRVIMGVEVDDAGAPAAYRLKMSHPGESEWQTAARNVSVPAAEIYHGFRAQRPEQARGVPWLHTAMIRLKHLSAYEEAAVVAARVGASKMGWIISPDGTTDALADDTDDAGRLYTEVEPGAIGTLPQGYDWKSFDPDYPSGEYGTFVQATLRGIASGLGVAYHSLANDLSSVNYSSARAGVIEERDHWRALQGWFSDCFLRPVFSDWLRAALLMGAVRLPNWENGLPASKADKFDAAQWIGRRWSWVDPLKDTQADVLAIQWGLKSRTEVHAEQGRDAVDVFTQLQAEEQLAAEYGVEISADTPAPAPSADEDNDEDGKDKPETVV